MIARDILAHGLIGQMVIGWFLSGCSPVDLAGPTSHQPTDQSTSTTKAYVDDVSAVEANSWWSNGAVQSDMGPTTAFACERSDPTGSMRQDGLQRYFYVAVSDSLMNEWTGRGYCDRNPYGGEPNCPQYKDLCGMKVTLKCKDGCGSQSLLSYIAKDGGYVKNAMGYEGKWSEYQALAKGAWDKLGQVGKQRWEVPTELTVIINDFCPRLHSRNQATGQCQGKQIDFGPGAWFMMMPRYRVNPQQYLAPDLKVEAELSWQTWSGAQGELGP